MKKISLFLNTFEFANNRESFGEKVTKNKFITVTLLERDLDIFYMYVMGAPVYRIVLNAR